LDRKTIRLLRSVLAANRQQYGWKLKDQLFWELPDWL